MKCVQEWEVEALMKCMQEVQVENLPGCMQKLLVEISTDLHARVASGNFSAMTLVSGSPAIPTCCKDDIIRSTSHKMYTVKL
jgi:hypothetical protein